jgi:hypothetical protein
MSKDSRAERDGWSDGFAGAEDNSCCQYKDPFKVQRYAKGRAVGYAAKIEADERAALEAASKETKQ